MVCRTLEVFAAQREPAERVADGRGLLRMRVLAQHLELGHVQLADHRVVAERCVEIARSLERLDAIGLELPRLLVVPQRAIDAAEVIVPEDGGSAVMRRATRD